MELRINIESLEERLQTIENLVRQLQPPLIDRWITNDEFCELLQISHKTAQSYRDKGILTFSQIGNKIHYKMSAVDELLDNHAKFRFLKR